MNEHFIKSLPTMQWEEIKKIKDKIKKIKPEDIDQLSEDEKEAIKNNKDVYHYLSFDVQIRILNINPENVKSKPFGDNTDFCIGMFQGKRKLEGLTESEEVYLEYLKKRLVVMEALEKQGKDIVEIVEILGFKATEDMVWEKHQKGEEVDGYFSKMNR